MGRDRRMKRMIHAPGPLLRTVKNAIACWRVFKHLFESVKGDEVIYLKTISIA